MSAMRRLLYGIGLAIGLGACSGPTITLSVAPPSDIDRTKGRPISATECGFQLLQLIPIATNDRHQEAYVQLKMQAGRDYIGDVVVTEDWYYGVIGSVYCTTLNAKAYPKAGS